MYVCYFHGSTTELYFRSITRQSQCYSKTKTTKYCLKHEGKSHPCHPWQNLKDSRRRFITRWRIFYKSVQLVQGVIMLISITIILLFNFEKTSHTSFCFFGTSKLVSPQFYCLLCFVLERNGEKTFQLTSISFVYMWLPDLEHIARIVTVRCTREAMFEVVQRHYIKIYQANFLLCYVKFIPL